MASDDIITPSVSYREKRDDPNNYIEVQVDIPGLKKQLFGSEASNANVKFTPSESSFVLDVVLNPGVEKGKKNAEQTFQYKVNRLPGFIDEKDSSRKVKDGRVEITLKKKVEMSWAGDLDNIGLDVEEG